MFRDEKIEMKVGLFIGVAIFLMFFIVFSISDLNVLRKGYTIKVAFDYVNGLTSEAPVRVSGVNAGEVKNIEIYYDEKISKTRVKVEAWIQKDIRLEKDVVARINMLGLLGEQYLEISPGTAEELLEDGDIIAGRSPINMSQQMEIMNELAGTIKDMVGRISKGEGTLGKLLSDDTLYNDLISISGKLSRGEGTIGKLLVEEKIYNDLEGFVSDIKAHPWKLLAKPSRSKRKKEAEKKGTEIQ